MRREGEGRREGEEGRGEEGEGRKEGGGRRGEEGRGEEGGGRKEGEEGGGLLSPFLLLIVVVMSIRHLTYRVKGVIKWTFTLREAAFLFLTQMKRTQCSAALPVFAHNCAPNSCPLEVKPHPMNTIYHILVASLYLISVYFCLVDQELSS